MVVLPLVPVMPMTRISSLGWRSYAAASTAIARRASETCAHGARGVRRSRMLGHDGDRAALNRLTYERRAVGMHAFERDEDLTRRDRSRVVGDARDSPHPRRRGNPPA